MGKTPAGEELFRAEMAVYGVVPLKAFDATSITLTFTSPADGGSAINGFQITCTTSALPPNNIVTRAVPANVTTFAVTGLLTNSTYVCTVRASNMIGYGPASGSVSVKPVVPTTPPTVSLILPPGTVVGKLAQGTINLVVTAQTAVGTLTLIEILDGTTLLTSFTPPPSTTSYTSPTYAWTTATLGSHTLTVKATNSQGTTASNATVVQVLVPPTITLTTASNFFFAPSTIDLVSVVTPAPGVGIFRVEFFANDGVTNTKINSDAFAPYGFSWANVAAGNYILTAVVSDHQGLFVNSAPVNVTVVNNVSLQIATPLNGSTVSGDTVLVSGSAITPPNSAVTINGQLATLAANGQFFINDLPLTAGTNTVTATVTAPDGQTASQVITLTRSATVPLFEVTVGQGGILVPGTPIVVNVTIGSAANTPFGEIAIQCAYPGPAVFTLTLGTYLCTYAAAGTYDVKVTVKDSVNVAIYSVTKRVKIDAAGDRERLLRSVYSGMLDRLKSGNIAGALNTLTSSIYDRYQALFTAQGAGLSALVDSLGTIQQVRVSDDLGEFLIIRNTANGPVGFMVYFIRAEDGIWRIDSM